MQQQTWLGSLSRRLLEKKKEREQSSSFSLSLAAFCLLMSVIQGRAAAPDFFHIFLPPC